MRAVFIYDKIHIYTCNITNPLPTHLKKLNTRNHASTRNRLSDFWRRNAVCRD